MPDTTDIGAVRLVPEYTHVPRLAAGSPELVDHLDEHGFAVVASALGPGEATAAVQMLWDYLEALGTGIDRNNATTWEDDRWPTAVHGGILPGHGIGHCAAQWYVRSFESIKKSFASVWDDDDLLVSFDGVSLWRPWGRNPAWRTKQASSWFHIDQHPIGRPGFHCVQGLVNLLPMSEATGGNVVIPGSHRLFESLPERYETRMAKLPTSIDHFRFPNEDPLLGDPAPIMCHLEPGDLFLWDSRTIHCSEPGPEDSSVTNELLRAVSLICMMPKARSNAEVISHRRAAVTSRISTTNWSDVWVNADNFPDVAAADPNKFRLPPVPELTEYQQALVG
jgi:hypothetical protein